MQKQAVTHGAGPLLVLAGPGTGKTRILTYRIAWALAESRVSPHVVTALTFTRKAAATLRERLTDLLEIDTDDLNIFTFHSLAYRILRAEHARRAAPQDGRLRVTDGPESFRLLKRAMAECGMDERKWDPSFVAREVFRAKEELVGPEKFVTVPGDYVQEHVGRAYRKYQESLDESDAIDFPDLIRLTLELFDREPDMLDHYQELSRLLLVDEFQDTNPAQYLLLRALAGKHRDVTCVGSPAQAIYAWRGASAEELLKGFRHDFPDACEVVVKQNYRSTAILVSAARGMTRGEYADACLDPVRPEGEHIFRGRFASANDEAAYVVEEVSSLVKGGSGHWKDHAVLFRTNAQSRPLEQACLERRVPYTLLEGHSFFQRQEITHALAYLKLATDPLDGDALSVILNAPPRGIGSASRLKLTGGSRQVTVEHLLAAESVEGLRKPAREGALRLADFLFNQLPEHAPTLPPSALLKFVLDEVGYRKWLEEDLEAERKRASLKELEGLATDFPAPEDLPAFLAHLDKLRAENLETDLGVVLSTIHGAKGLEFPVVFVVGLEEGLLPHANALRTHRDPPEERRLMYVAMTRAKDRLYLCHTRLRGQNGTAREARPSRYFSDIPPEFIERRELS